MALIFGFARKCGRASLDNPPFAIRPQRMGHPGWSMTKRLVYSVRRASMGSIFAARRQGRAVAAMAATAKRRTTGSMTERSVGEVL